ncbi:mercury transporter MerT [bacterium]|jgi:mercuric ion transport protein|nr:mercury transporter MerT [bacterium]
MTSADTVKEQQETNSFNNDKQAATGWLSSIALLSGIGAIAASSCCVLPLFLAAVGASAGVFSVFQSLAEWKLPILAVSGISVVGAWYSWWRKRNRNSCSTTGCSNQKTSSIPTMLLFVSTMIIALAFSWDKIEPVLLKAIRGNY